VNEILTGVGTHLLSTAIGYAAGQSYHSAIERRGFIGQRAVLAGFDQTTFFVFPERDPVDEDAILPRTATEDFLAINNLISAFQKCRMKPPEKVRNPDRLGDKEKQEHSLILICSPIRNATSREFLAKLREVLPQEEFPYFEEYEECGKLRRLVRWKSGTWKSPSWGQEAPKFEDVAVLMKTTNPWNPKLRVLFLAGARGIGTWGAGEFVKKWWNRLLTHTGGKLDAADNFAAVLQVIYENRDIKDVNVLECHTIRQPLVKTVGD
jgi:hypothetical protein